VRICLQKLAPPDDEANSRHHEEGRDEDTVEGATGGSLLADWGLLAPDEASLGPGHEHRPGEHRRSHLARRRHRRGGRGGRLWQRQQRHDRRFCADEWERTTTPATTTPAPAAKPPPPPSAPRETASQRNARESAESYLENQAFSRCGLINQLSSQYGAGFPKADAIYAVDHIDVNWNAQAVRAAKDYLDTQSFSRSGLIQQLQSPYGACFTHAQAVYGVNKAYR
jgi:hypothetical protein